jgi:hypothetical protein
MRSFGEPTTLADGIQRLTGISARIGEPVTAFRYSVTNHRVTLVVHRASAPTGEPRAGQNLVDARWVETGTLGRYTFSSPGRKLIAWINRSGER